MGSVLLYPPAVDAYGGLTGCALYTRMGFVREPAYDFRPGGAELVEAYRLAL